MSDETPVKTADSAQPMMPGKNGGMLRRGGPNGGAGGRPRDEDKAFVEQLLASPECRTALETLLKYGAMKDAKLWLAAWNAAWEKVKSKPAQEVHLEHSGEVGLVKRPPEYTVEGWAELCNRAKN